MVKLGLVPGDSLCNAEVQGVVASWRAPSGKLIWRAAFAREPMFVTGYDEANRADLGWQQSHPEKSGKQALKFISFSVKGRAGRVHILNQSLSTKFCAHGFEVSVLTRNSLLSAVWVIKCFKIYLKIRKTRDYLRAVSLGLTEKMVQTYAETVLKASEIRVSH